MSLRTVQVTYHCRICNCLSVCRLSKTVVLQLNRSAAWFASRHAVRVPLRQSTWNIKQLRNWPTWLSSKFRLLSPQYGIGTILAYLTLGGVSGAISYELLKTLHIPVNTLSNGSSLQCSPSPTAVDSIDDKHTGVVSGSHQITEGHLSLFQRLRLVFRFFYLSVCFSPAALLYSLGYLFGVRSLSQLGFNYLLFVLQNTGPAFIKLGQWASTRRDLFSEDFCHAMSQLHTHCDPHPWKETAKIISDEFGKDWEQWLVIPSQKPIGSGCVAQVYQGYLKLSGQTRCEKPVKPVKLVGSIHEEGPVSSVENEMSIPMAVKVLHPGIVAAMDRDIRLMKYMASWVDYLYPDVYWIALNECVGEFTMIMEKQLDLELEARNLLKFQSYMRGYSNVKFPTPLYPYVSKSVLVESFESGSLISEYLDNPGGDLQKTIAKIGIDVLLDMLFVHNFIHGDLHPGNILVQNGSQSEPKLVILDCGIATTLSQMDLENFHSVFAAIVRGDGTKVADLFLGTQPCPTLDEYRRKMAVLVETAVTRLNLQQTQMATLFSDLFNILIEHRVRIEPNYTSVMVAIMIIEGLGRSLDPSLDILAYARPCIMQRAKQHLRDHLAERLARATETVERVRKSLSYQTT